MKKVLIMGLPGSGKTKLALALRPLIRAVHFNADAVRENINKDLGFSKKHRIEQARRMGWLCDRVVEAGHYAIADFVCPLPEGRRAFGDAFVVYTNTEPPVRYRNTQKIFVSPERIDYEVAFLDAAHHARSIAAMLQAPTAFNWRAPTAIFIGRYQPFHRGHRDLILEGLERVPQACIAVRDTAGIDEKNPFDFDFIKARIEDMMGDVIDKIAIIQIPNVTNVFYGRDVGYSIERLILPEAIQAISATKLRSELKNN